MMEDEVPILQNSSHQELSDILSVVSLPVGQPGPTRTGPWHQNPPETLGISVNRGS